MDIRQSILIVDDHQSIRDALAAYLKKCEFEVEAVADGIAMRQQLEERAFDLIILDIMLPGENGLLLCRYVSERIGTPIILLTAVTDQADRVAGLEIGADDYIVKPFDPRELVARVRNVLRRSASKKEFTPGVVVSQTGPSFTFSGWMFDTSTRELFDPSGNNIPLSTTEFYLLKALVENANQVLSRSQLLDLTQRTEAITFDRSIDSQISRLRKKLESAPRQPGLLKTIRGDGYMLATKVIMIAS